MSFDYNGANAALHAQTVIDARCLIPEFDGAFLSSEGRDALMGQILHGSATTTEAIRRAIQRGKENDYGLGFVQRPVTRARA